MRNWQQLYLRYFQRQVSQIMNFLLNDLHHEVQQQLRLRTGNGILGEQHLDKFVKLADMLGSIDASEKFSNLQLV